EQLFGNPVPKGSKSKYRNIPTFDELNLPESVLTKVCDSMQGLVLFAGITGCGKSTSIAACLGHINARRKCHIVTIEDPIEFLFEDDKSFINQREVGTDVRDFESAMRTLLREDPDVVLIGEMRDRETFETVLRVAETGHLVFATIHASSASGVITRILDLFPSEEHALIRQSLASNLVAIVCQKLVPSVRKDVERVPATEVLLQDVVVRKMIVQGQESRLADVLAGGNIDGSHNFTISFRELVARDWVTRRVAMQYAPDPDALRMALKGISIKTSTLD
ncbi:MAG: type IV pilus twitching motility protein PilT, partial [Planctomycetia bacterium]|nr:type IV pilus twitching motility protein PilT [Planctomycetia bacterium]